MSLRLLVESLIGKVTRRWTHEGYTIWICSCYIKLRKCCFVEKDMIVLAYYWIILLNN